MDHYFSLRCNLLLYVFLKPPEHEWLEHSVESLKLDFIEFALVETARLNIFTEPLLELLMTIK